MNVIGGKMNEITSNKTTLREPGTLVYIVSASGPYPEKAMGADGAAQLFTCFSDAEQAAERANAEFHPAKFTVHEMIMFPVV